MSGIAGYVGLDRDGGTAVARRMARQLTWHRPPGPELTRAVGSGLVHPCAAGGAGSARSPDGRWLLACDGTIYNLAELREALADPGQAGPGGGPAEVLLAAWLRWGDEAFDRGNGGFAVAIMDTETGSVVLARDQLGLHPLYLAADGSGRVAFATEIRPVLAAAVVPRQPDGVTVYRYLRFGVHDDTERTFFARVTRVLPGATVRISPDGTVACETYTRLWRDLDGMAARPYDRAAREQVVTELTAAVRRRLPRTVPMGVVQSDGDLSSTVHELVAQVLVRADREAGAPARTRAVHDVTRRSDRPLDDLVDFVRAQEEPVGTMAAFAHYTVVRQAARHVPMILDGLGAEEILAGRPAHQAVRLRQLLRQRRLGEAAIEAVRGWPVLRRAWDATGRRRTGPGRLLLPLFAAAHVDQRWEPVRADLKRRLAGDVCRDRLPALLRYHHRNTRWFSVEQRAPLLDPALLRVLWSLTDEALLYRGRSLRVLRDAAADLSPGGAASGPRPRPGRPAPSIDRYLTRLLRRAEPAFADLLAPDQLRCAIYVDPHAVATAYRRCLAGGTRVDEDTLWRVINLELWLREFIELDPTVPRELATGVAVASAGLPPQHLAADQVQHVVDLADAQQHRQAHVAAAHYQPAEDEVDPRLAGGERG